MAHETTYEVYTLADGRWLLDTSFKKSQRERAIDEGKKLAKQPGIEAAKVLREIYDDDDNLIKESTVYNSQKKETQSSSGGFDDRDLAAPAYNVPGFEDLEAQQEFKEEEDYDEDQGSSTGAFGKRKRGAGTDQSQPNAGAQPMAPPPRRGGLRRPEFMLVYKMFIIGAVSFAFAAFTTLIFVSNFS